MRTVDTIRTAPLGSQGRSCFDVSREGCRPLSGRPPYPCRRSCCRCRGCSRLRCSEVVRDGRLVRRRNRVEAIAVNDRRVAGVREVVVQEVMNVRLDSRVGVALAQDDLARARNRITGCRVTRVRHPVGLIRRCELACRRSNRAEGRRRIRIRRCVVLAVDLVHEACHRQLECAGRCHDCALRSQERIRVVRGQVATAAVPADWKLTSCVRTPPLPEAAVKFAGTPPGNEAVNVSESTNDTPEAVLAVVQTAARWRVSSSVVPLPSER